MSQAYTDSGVDITKGQDVVTGIEKHVTDTWDENVVSHFGDFAGMYNLNGNILVTSTDGVGTKTIAALQTLGDKAFYSLGQDIVNHCVNDILVKGARPLFFLDYFASNSLKSENVIEFVRGASDACKSAGCALIGGETAEMPDVYHPGHVDIVGTIVGVSTNIVNGREQIHEGMRVYGLPSSGPHTNGYSLIRKLVPDLLPQDVAPHKSYLGDIQRLQEQGVDIAGLCHITGGGWRENIKRILPDGLGVDLAVPRLDSSSIFSRVQKAGGLEDDEMLTVFNMGIGMLIFTDSHIDEMLLGTVVSGDTHIKIT